MSSRRCFPMYKNKNFAELLPNLAKNTLILHASDLHFGAHIPEMLEQFRHLTQHLAPSLVVLSGDLTDGGRAKEYKELAVYLAALHCPVFIAAGNHDAPVDNLLKRLLSPFADFDALPSYRNSYHANGLEVAELRTAAPIQSRLDWSKGVSTPRRVERALNSFTASLSPSITPSPRPWRIIVSHHPIIDAPEIAVAGRVVGGLAALQACETFGVDLVLSGHTHQSWFGRNERHSVLLATAPTLSSPRIRGEGQGFHAYSFSDHEVLCDVWRWDVTDFALESSKVHVRRPQFQNPKEPSKA
jgi:predicted MPP superfamily phosphohydrolase